jgi:UDP-3-O-[3-hydroxymyristoyl] glucosamine N-acyltransferase
MPAELHRDVPLAELIERFGGELSGPSSGRGVRGLASLSAAGPADLSFLSAARHRDAARATAAAAVVVTPQLAEAVAPGSARIVVADAYAHYARIARWFAEQLEPARAAGIHPTACVDPGASLGAGVSVGPYAVVEAGARIGDGATVSAQCFVGRAARIGDGTLLHPRVTVLHGCELGARCIVHSGTVIGSDGFGFAREGGRWAKIPQLGRVLIGDDVEIGSNCSIDRGALDDTVIGDGCKLDNLIQIAHNVRIGEHSALAGCVGVAGSAVIGRRCMIGGGAGISGHLEICDDVVVGGMTMISRTIRQPGFYNGTFPTMDNASWEKAAVAVKRLPELRARLRELGSAAHGTGPADGAGAGPDAHTKDQT